MFKRSALPAAFGLLLAGCSSTHVYPGPERPPEQVSKVYFHSFGPVTLSNMTIDDTTQGLLNIGLDVPPGTHRLSADYQFDDNDCFERAGCRVNTYYGTCTGEYQGVAGATYQIDITVSAGSGFVSVHEMGKKEIVGNGTCS